MDSVYGRSETDMLLVVILGFKFVSLNLAQN